jgi:hypothetical protein
LYVARLSTLTAAVASSAATSPNLTVKAGSQPLNSGVSSWSLPQGLYTSLFYLIRTEQTATKIQPHHFRLGISGRRLVQAYGDCWLYRGLGYISEAEKAKGEVFRDIDKRNLTATPLTYELF